jgi:hypothetical protein
MTAKKRTILMTSALLALSLGACATRPTPEDASVSHPGLTVDDPLVEVAKRIPEFGGMFFDDNGDLNVYMVEAERALSPQAREAQKVHLKEALTAVLGPEFLTQDREQRATLRGQAAPQSSPEIKVIQGEYTVMQLAKWLPGVAQALNVPGVVLVDLDEGQNRLRIGIESSAARAPVEAMLVQQGIPLAAVIIEETGPIKFTASLRDKHSPVLGGIQIEADTGVFASKRCTLGFTALRDNVMGFVTNSHCTKTRGGSEDTDFHQPTDPLFSEANKIGDEIADPPYVTNEMLCPAGKRCRFSDSAFVRYNNNVQSSGNIAKTTSSTGSITLDDFSPDFRIVSETATPVVGTILNKVGRTTGWTFGRVAETCVYSNVTDTDIRLLCQNRVDRITGTHKIVDEGDSGSPVFTVSSGNDVSLHGVLWGEANDGSTFLFSSLSRIEQELGPLTTVFLPPPPPLVCPLGEKCCELSNTGNLCLLCIPETDTCPSPPPHACPLGQKCCEPEEGGCRLCVPPNAECP